MGALLATDEGLPIRTAQSVTQAVRPGPAAPRESTCPTACRDRHAQRLRYTARVTKLEPKCAPLRLLRIPLRQSNDDYARARTWASSRGVIRDVRIHRRGHRSRVHHGRLSPRRGVAGSGQRCGVDPHHPRHRCGLGAVQGQGGHRLEQGSGRVGQGRDQAGRSGRSGLTCGRCGQRLGGGQVSGYGRLVQRRRVRQRRVPIRAVSRVGFGFANPSGVVRLYDAA